MKKRLQKILLCLFVLTVAYLVTYYPGDKNAIAAMRSDETVAISRTDYGWYFDGPSEDDVLIFYAGANIEETAYAPLLHNLAEHGMDACLLKLPFRVALFATDKADEVIRQYHYKNCYVGGHSLGGLTAGLFAHKTSLDIKGVILLASYLYKPVRETMHVISIYGTEDKVLNIKKVKEMRNHISGVYDEFVIEGGNHTQFGNYRKQILDGDPKITWQEQQQRTVEIILKCTKE